MLEGLLASSLDTAGITLFDNRTRAGEKPKYLTSSDDNDVQKITPKSFLFPPVITASVPLFPRYAIRLDDAGLLCDFILVNIAW